MRTFTFTLLFVLTAFTGFSLAPSQAQNPAELADGNRIAAPLLADYTQGERMPGFSPITDIEYR